MGSGLSPLAGYRTRLTTNRHPSGWPSAAIAAQVQHYDPQSELIILVLRNDQTLMAYRLGSTALPPPVAYARLRQPFHALAA